MMETIVMFFYDARMRLANFISGGELRRYAHLNHAHDVSYQMVRFIAQDALQCTSIKKAREQFEEELKRVEAKHYERINDIVDGKYGEY